MRKKILPIAFLLGTAILTWASIYEGQPKSALGKEIYNDLRKAQDEKFFPEQFNSLENIKITSHSKDPKLAKKIQENSVLPFETKKDGKYTLQIDALEILEPIAEAQLILQFNLFENQTGNKIWESSRLYHLEASTTKDLLNQK
jgi:hypothetical protein